MTHWWGIRLYNRATDVLLWWDKTERAFTNAPTLYGFRELAQWELDSLRAAYPELEIVKITAKT